jgi:hypothetical protein
MRGAVVGYPDRHRNPADCTADPGGDWDEKTLRTPRFVEFFREAEQVEQTELPPEHPLWKPWALDLAAMLKAVIRAYEELERSYEQRLRDAG